ncbi:hypothetical protein WG906_08020 [Pedobacter sp. P351]|uniref:hypothetical protein n=1 Tax=Pedobacter superstes TaxID=3133441 RepID=UPI0030A58008
MKTEHTTRDLNEAIDLFLRELPDPNKTNDSTFTDDFLIAGSEVILKAQKVKGSTGMKWKIDYNN